MRIMSWNINLHGLDARVDAIAEAISGDGPDLLLLQEVPRASQATATLVEALGRTGLTHHCLDRAQPSAGESRKSYGSLIASRWRLTPNPGFANGVRFPELLTRATVHAPVGDLDVFSVHIPNGSGHGWGKIDHLLALASELVRADDSPRIVCGDFNEPRTWQTNGRLIPFAYDPDANGSERMTPHVRSAHRDRPDDERELAWWDYGVRSVLDGERFHGLRHIYHDRHGYSETPVTYRTRAHPRFFDHGFVSRHFEVEDAGYHHAWRHPRSLSDHSPLWADLRRVPTDRLPDLVRWSAP